MPIWPTGPGGRCVAVAFDGDKPRLALWLPGKAGTMNASTKHQEIKAALDLYDRAGLHETPATDASGNPVPATVTRPSVTLVRQSDRKTDAKYNFFLQDIAQPVTLGMTYDPANPDPTLMVSKQSGSLKGAASGIQWHALSQHWGTTPSVTRTVSRPWVEWTSNKPVPSPSTLRRTEQTSDPQDEVPPYTDPTNLTYFVVGTQREITLIVHVLDTRLGGRAIVTSLDPSEAGTLSGDTQVIIPPGIPTGGIVCLRLRVKGARPTPSNGQDNLVLSIEGGAVFGKVPITINRVNLTVDSNNDGEITDDDDAIEVDADKPGKLISLNQDDDNLNDRPDWKDDGQSNGQTFSQDDDDLQPMKLAFSPSQPKGRIVLEALEGSGSIKLWKDRRKTQGSQVKLSWKKATWNLPGDAVPDTLYIEGVSAGSVRLRLSYFNGNDEIWRNEVKAGVVSVDFAKRTDTAYGYDDGVTDDNPGHTSKNGWNPPQIYKWVSVEVGNSTAVDVTINPSLYQDQVYFVPSDGAKISSDPPKAASTPQKLTIAGKGEGTSGSQPYVLCRLGGQQGAIGARLNVGSYKMRNVNYNYYDVNAPGLPVDATVTPVTLALGANAILQKAVVSLTLIPKDPIIDVYDGIPGEPGDYHKGALDIDLTIAPPYGAEFAVIFNKLPASGNIVLHVPRLWAKRNTGWSDASFSLPSPNERIVIIADSSSDKPVTLAHEVLHRLSLSDTGPQPKNDRNVMYCWSNAMKYFLGNCAVAALNGSCSASDHVEYQWDQVVVP